MSAQNYETIQLEIEDHVALLTLNRPAKLNAISGVMAREIVEACASLGDARVLVMTGNERAFSAGADLSERAGGGERFSTVAAYDAVAGVPVPAIAAIEGYALGGGLELAMCCDLRVASEAARLGQPEVLRGIAPGGGGTQRLPRLIGPGRAKDLLFTGRHIDGATAEAWGLVNRLTPTGQALEIAGDLARQIAILSGPVALREIKALVNKGYDLPLDDALRMERERTAPLYETADAVEGIRAFLERREPEFKGE